MYQKERLDKIYKLIEKDKYLTVKYITEKIHYSTATVNRDLNELVKQKRIKRTYGGAEVIENNIPPIPYRYEKAKPEKKRIAKKACSLIKEGETVFIDGSTTTQYLGEYLLEIKDVHIITTNISLAMFLSGYGVKTTVLGGEIQEAPSMLSGDLTIQNVKQFVADKCFFSSSGLNKDGKIMRQGSGYITVLREMVKNSKASYCLIDKSKFNDEYHYVILTLSDITGVVANFDFPEEMKNKFSKTKFIRA